MRISGLWLQHFRNVNDHTWKFQPGLNIFSAPNGSGKSNLIEALSLLSSGSSWRAKTTDEVIQWDEELARIQSKIDLLQNTKQKSTDDLKIDELKLEQLFTHGILQGKKTTKRLYRVNGVNRRAGDAIGQLLSVLFTPEDMELFQSGGSARRRLLDGMLDQVDPAYRRARQNYEKALRRRNRLLRSLREGEASRQDFFYWDHLLIENGAVIHNARSEFLHWLDTQSGFKEDYQIEYDHSVISEARLLQYERAELASGYTLVGPHKDDVIVRVKRGGDWRNIERFGSRGEQRLALVWWKLSEVQYLEMKRGEIPVLLLDDVFSELDDANQQIIEEAASRSQAIITTVEEGYPSLFE